MKKNSKKDYAIAFYETSKGLKGKELGQAIHNFVALLHKKHLLHQVEAVIREFIAYAKKQQGIVDINITGARKLDRKVLENIMSAFGKEVDALEKIDESLIGGFVVRTSDRIFDASIKTQLTRLKQNLM